MNLLQYPRPKGAERGSQSGVGRKQGPGREHSARRDEAQEARGAGRPTGLTPAHVAPDEGRRTGPRTRQELRRGRARLGCKEQSREPRLGDES